MDAVGVLEFGRLRNDVLRLTRTCEDRDIPLAVYSIADSRGIDAGADIKAPQLLERLRIIGAERAVDVSEEDEIPVSRERAGEVRVVEPKGRFGLSACRSWDRARESSSNDRHIACRQ